MRKSANCLMAAMLSLSLVCGMVSTATLSEAASLKLNKTKVTLKAGKTFKLTVKGKYKGKVKWTSSKKKVATVSSKGLVKAVAKGKATITAKVAKKKMTCKVTVNPNSASEATKAPATQVPTQTPTQTPTQVPATQAPTQAPATQAPAATETPEPTETPAYMAEGAFVYEKLDISWIDKDRPMVAFTFDDGPVGSEDSSNSMRIQAALAKYGFHATFNYVTSKFNSETNKKEVLAAMEAGHEIANHTSQWGSLSDMADGEKVAAEIEKGRKDLEELTGIPNFTLRPPNLGVNDMVLKNCNVPLIGCNIYTNDWVDGTTKEQIIKNAEAAKDGDIILMHETNKLTADAVEEELVDYFYEKGFQIVSVVELFAAKDIPLYPGVLYNKAELKEPRED